MPQRPVLFIDDGGVMNDNRVRGEQWAVLVGEYFSERVGGEAERWEEVNRTVFAEAFDVVLAQMRSFKSHGEFERAYADSWVAHMFNGMGLQPPVSRDERMLHYFETGRRIPPRVRAAFPGVVDSIRALQAAGYDLHTASGESSVELQGYLQGMEVRSYFGHLYGPDIVDIPKAAPEYYRRAFVHAGVEPADAVVLDDSAEACDWAREAGASAVQVGDGGDAASLAAFADQLLAGCL